MDEGVLGPRHKSVPPALWGLTPAEAVATGVRLRELATPVMTLDRAASDANTAIMTAWAREHGLELAPHGKTTMAPELWRRLLDAGCWGITLATPWQVQVARAAGLARVVLANEVVDPVAASWIAAELDRDPAFELVCWVDSPESVAALAATAGERPIDVLVELGDDGGRTGARGLDAALEVAHAVASSPRLRLRGVAGYEGSYGADREPATAERVRGYLRGMASLFDRVEGMLHSPILTAGGSAWFDLVAEEFEPYRERATVVVRAGAFQAHDDVFYTGISPFAGQERAFRPALHAWARVVSRPEPGLALLDAGKRDVPSDLGMPVAPGIAGAVVTQLADQHAYLRVPPATELVVGEVVRLGISHPCTAFQLWRLMPEVDDADAEDPRVIGFVETVF
ncbi:MAG: alanine racemase [Microbacteriaceae bacterium]|nr:alanine racemase [Microbacteriaceae bacterium]